MLDPPPTRKLTIIAKDPGLRIGSADGPMVFTQVAVPAEILAKGPTGYRIKVVDYNATERRAYLDGQDYQLASGVLVDPFAPGAGEDLLDPAYQRRLLAEPNFHAQNVYAIAMRTLGAFERALGRRVGWSSGGHQLHTAPHAFAQANAFYSEPDRALMFGYFHRDDGTPVFTCLSHDIVAHETTHAVLDGLRSRLTEASSPDQAAFHEGFADIVAILSIFSLEPVVAAAIGEDGVIAQGKETIKLVSARRLKPAAIKKSILLGIAMEIGNELNDGGRGALRQSVELTPKNGKELRDDPDEHARGEVIVAAMMNAFVLLWGKRIAALGKFEGDRHNLASVVEEGAKVAGHLLTMAIRALDYCPPTDLDFSQYLSALLTADRELVPDDDHQYRPAIRASFRSYGIITQRKNCDEEGCWKRLSHPGQLTYARSNYVAMTRNTDEMFRFLWENRNVLGISERAYTEVLSIDQAARLGPDGIMLHETVCQYVQRVDLFGAEFKSVLGAERPDGMKSNDRITAYGGGVLILDQYGQVKYHIANRIFDGPRQRARGQYLLDVDQLGGAGIRQKMRFALSHQQRMGA
ncbi:hypothetical protein NKI86_06990 [Mesorhizobium sp. M0320]|uniref:hypothetical protein n=1 Tax=Mesorhizobium sp. M0320 TaxID=2956936 RepID=UPI00333A7EBC